MTRTQTLIEAIAKALHDDDHPSYPCRWAICETRPIYLKRAILILRICKENGMVFKSDMEITSFTPGCAYEEIDLD